MGEASQYIHQKRKVEWVRPKLIYPHVRRVRQGWRCNHVTYIHISRHMKSAPYNPNKNNIFSSQLKKNLYIYWEQPIYYSQYVAKKRNILFLKQQLWRFAVCSQQKWGKKQFLNRQIRTCGFHCVAKHVQGSLKICTLFLVYSQTWLILPRDARHSG